MFRLHGFLKTKISDQDNKFTSAFWQGKFNLVGTNLDLSTMYHSSTSGQTKRVNQWIEGYLWNYATGNKKGMDYMVALGRVILQHKFPYIH